MGKLVNLAGRRFHRLKVIERSPAQPNGQAAWLCRCDCGHETVVVSQALRSGGTRSCGCLKLERVGLMNKSHGATETRLANIWYGMRKRCTNPNAGSYKNYGGRGIKVSPEWSEFDAFQQWALANGYALDLTIDRIDNDGDYTPSNCQWITRSENSKRRFS